MATLTPTAKRIVSFARLAGFEVRIGESAAGVYMLAFRRASVGLASFKAAWPTSSAAAWSVVQHVGWHEWPLGVTELEVALVAEVYRLRGPGLTDG